MIPVVFVLATLGSAARPGDLAPPGSEDGCLSAADASLALSIVVQKYAATAAQLATADVSGDGQVSVLDVVRLLDAAVLNTDLPTPPCLAGCADGSGYPWQSTETTCDDIDNDCDGAFDEGCCTPGTAGCKCLPAGGCGALLSCVGTPSLCQPCPTGAGCGCTTDAQCGAGLRCDAGACIACTPGALGCSCNAGACSDCGHCVSGRCTTDPALPGAEGCACGAQNACAGLLLCDGGLCTECPPGSPGCPCVSGALCAENHSCQGGTCKPCKGSPCEPCTPGETGCTCEGETCDGEDVCVGGVCQPSGCQQGELGCPCYGNGSCLPVQGIPLQCKAGLCALPDVKAPGSLGTPCSGPAQCGSFQGAGLSCNGGLCSLAGCPFGSPGCPCTAGGGCAGAPDIQCKLGLCVSASCSVGYAGCSCLTTGACVPGLDCVAGICGHAGEAYLKINASNSRACDILLEDSADARITDVTYAPGGASGCGAYGIFRRRGNRVAMAFICTADTAMVGRQARLTLNNATATSQDLEVLSFVCYDRLGHPIPDLSGDWE
ncbi:MAG: hypothetical protein IV100_02950 [Myxococcales bacterium]|nr:hypothetical protein [Myxococcales bacterium]